MKAALFEAFRAPVQITDLPDPTPADDGVVVAVRATGVCRSDWHGWMGHDADITPPHVPGHELAGEVVALGSTVRRFRVGDRVTVPFVCGCGSCTTCAEGDHQVCPNQEQPGFTHHGSFAEFVALRYADTNLVALPPGMDYVTAAALGCRFATSYRAVRVHARPRSGDWVAVHGCGGVGLSAVMIAAAMGAQVLAVDIDDAKLRLARELGAAAVLRADQVDDLAAAVADCTGGGAHASLDALGGVTTMRNSIDSLRRRGRHVQVGLLVGDESSPPVPMDRVLAHELEVLGSHGMPAHAYGEMLAWIAEGRLAPDRLLGRTVDLATGVAGLQDESAFADAGVTVIDRFS